MNTQGNRRIIRLILSRQDYRGRHGRQEVSQKSSAGDAVSLADVERAAAVIKGHVLNTDCDPSLTLGEIVGANIWLKFENLQFTAAFKERGALNRLVALSPAERQCGVVAMSAGNHAQGVAYHAKRLGIPVTIVMPVGTPMVKVENTRRHGATVIVTGATLEDAAAAAVAHGEQSGQTFIHPYDDSAGHCRARDDRAGDVGGGA